MLLLQGTTYKINLKIDIIETSLTPNPQLTLNLPGGQDTFHPRTLLNGQPPPDQ